MYVLALLILAIGIPGYHLFKLIVVMSAHRSWVIDRFDALAINTLLDLEEFTDCRDSLEEHSSSWNRQVMRMLDRRGDPGGVSQVAITHRANAEASHRMLTQFSVSGLIKFALIYTFYGTVIWYRGMVDPTVLNACLVGMTAVLGFSLIKVVLRSHYAMCWIESAAYMDHFAQLINKRS